MDDDAIWTAIDAERLRLAELLTHLTDAEWQTASLCDGWTVRDVAAHLTLQQMGLGEALRMLVKHPGPMNRVIRESARDKAALPVARLITELRATVGSRRHNVGVSNRETLIDILVHSQDIARPLNRDLPIFPAPAVEAAIRVWSQLGTSMGRVFRPVPWGDYRFAATDADWSAGTGAEVTGPIGAVLLLLTGRTVALGELSGPGVVRMRESLTQPRRAGRR